MLPVLYHSESKREYFFPPLQTLAKSIKSVYTLSRLTSASGLGQGQRKLAGFHPDESRREESRWIGRCSARNTAAGVWRVMNHELAAFTSLPFVLQFSSLLHRLFCVGPSEQPGIMVVSRPAWNTFFKKFIVSLIILIYYWLASIGSGEVLQ